MPKTVNYDPKKEYSWEPDDTFTMTGVQFASFYHCFMREMNHSGGATMGVKVEAYQVMMAIFLQGIADGKVKENKEPLTTKLDVEKDPIVNNLFATP